MAKFVHHGKHGEKVLVQKRNMKIKDIGLKLVSISQFLMICFLFLKAIHLI
jgi:hypothetical protein